MPIKVTPNLLLPTAEQRDGPVLLERSHPTKNEDFFTLYHHGSIPTSLPIVPSRGHNGQHQEGINLNIACFPRRLFQMLETIKHAKRQFSNIVSWHRTGRSFVIHEPDAFVSQVMPVFFRSQSKLSSFRRQLNNYGFQFTHDQNNVRKFTCYHQFFLRDEPKLCRKIVLKRCKKSKKKKYKSPAPSTSSILYRKEETRLALLFKEVQQPRLHSFSTSTSTSRNTPYCDQADHQSTNQAHAAKSDSLSGFSGDNVLDAAAAEVCFPNEGEEEQKDDEEEAPTNSLFLAEERPIKSFILEDGIGWWDPAIESLDTINFEMLF